MSSSLIGRAWLWASQKPKIEHLVTHGRLTRRVVDRFIAGRDLEDAVEVIKDLNGRGIGGILDLLGEGVSDAEGAEAAYEAYLAGVKRISETGIDTTVSLKLTQLGLGFDKGACIDHLRKLAAEAEVVGAGLEIDMEQSAYVDDTFEVFRLMQVDYPTLRLALQSYLRRTSADLEAMSELRPKIRLVKGAYSEHVDVAFRKRLEIDAQYRFLTDRLFENGTDPAIATHDDRLINHARKLAAQQPSGNKSFEIQMLYGIRRELQEELARTGHRVRVYVPYGAAWYPYLMRRIAERPANLRFFLRALVGN
jgi:proline dehydrogenase